MKAQHTPYGISDWWNFLSDPKEGSLQNWLLEADTESPAKEGASRPVGEPLASKYADRKG